MKTYYKNNKNEYLTIITELPGEYVLEKFQVQIVYLFNIAYIEITLCSRRSRMPERIN